MPTTGLRRIEMGIEILLVETVADCTNAGPCCLGCPAFDQCPQHYDEED